LPSVFRPGKFICFPHGSTKKSRYIVSNPCGLMLKSHILLLCPILCRYLSYDNHPETHEHRKISDAMIDQQSVNHLRLQFHSQGRHNHTLEMARNFRRPVIFGQQVEACLLVDVEARCSVVINRHEKDSLTKKYRDSELMKNFVGGAVVTEDGYRFSPSVGAPGAPYKSGCISYTQL